MAATGWGAQPQEPASEHEASADDDGGNPNRWGGPTGLGVRVAIVEGNQPDYLPHRTDPRLTHVTIHPRSGDAKSNHHATASVATLLGRSDTARGAPGAPGVRDIDAFTTQGFMTDHVLHAGSTDPPGNPGHDDVFSHAWIGQHPLAREVLRRIDFLIDSQNVVMCVGVNNGPATAVPQLLASGFNSIAVGSRAGASSGGFTRFEGDGRCKPDLIAPHQLTSFATAQVAAAAARLIQASRPAFADGHGGHGDDEDDGEDQENDDAHGERAQVRPPAILIKALLLAGATKPKDWNPAGHPLDEHLGAGLLNYDASLAIFRAGRLQAAPRKIRQARGYDLPTVEPLKTTTYRFDVVQDLGELSVILTWNRRIDGRRLTDVITGQTRWIDAARLADMDLRLTRLDDQGHPQIVAESRSFIDNVEHIHLPLLPAGRYLLDITRKDGFPDPWDAALALRIESPPKPRDKPAPQE
jgi:hypothetical protein